MSTLYKKLIDNDTKGGRESAILLDTDRSREAQLSGLRISIFVLFVLTLAAIAGSGLLYRRASAGKNEQKSMEAKLVQLREKTQALESELKTHDQRMNLVRGDLEARTSEKQELEKKFNRLTAKMTEAQVQIEQLKAEREAAEKKSQELEVESQNLGLKSQDLREKLEAASPVMRNYSPETVLPAQRNLTASSKDAKTQAEAAVLRHRRILTVNRRFNFVVINLGLKDHLKIGDKLAVDRDGSNIGTVEVEKAYDHVAAATIINEGRKNPFKEGDAVRMS